MTLAQYLAQKKLEFADSGCEYGDLDSHLQKIVEGALGWSAVKIFAESQTELAQADQEKIERIVQLRLEGEPLQYILGEAWFWKSRFIVGPGVLIPRPETELLVERCLGIPAEAMKVAELGAGSGNIGMSVLLERPQWEWHAFELSSRTAKYTRQNQAALLNSTHRYHLHEGNFFELAHQYGPYDLLISNPPYIAHSELATLSTEVQNEPRLALDGGADGIDFIQKLIATAPTLLKPGGHLILEIGSDQKESTLKLAHARFPDAQVYPDFAGHPRFLVGTL